MPRDGLSDPEEAIDVWPRGGCWLEDEACQFKGLERLEGLAGRMKHANLRVWSVWRV